MMRLFLVMKDIEYSSLDSRHVLASG
jgi:hypothetical protein